MAKQSLQMMAHASVCATQCNFLSEIFLSGMCVDAFLNKNLITENLRNTAVQQNHAKPLLDPKFWRERERERGGGGGIKTLGPYCRAISSLVPAGKEELENLRFIPAVNVTEKPQLENSPSVNRNL